MTMGVRGDLGSRAVLLCGGLVLGFLLAGSGGPRAVFAQQAGGPSLFAVTAPGQGQGNNVLFVIDPSSARLLVYEHRAGGMIELTAVRNIEYETQFQQWPAPDAKAPTGSQPPVKEIRDQLHRQTQRPGG